jgi:hypothetical protein
MIDDLLLPIPPANEPCDGYAEKHRQKLEREDENIKIKQARGKLRKYLSDEINFFEK